MVPRALPDSFTTRARRKAEGIVFERGFAQRHFDYGECVSLDREGC
jgi:hypothetical protein